MLRIFYRRESYVMVEGLWFRELMACSDGTETDQRSADPGPRSLLRIHLNYAVVPADIKALWLIKTITLESSGPVYRHQ